MLSREARAVLGAPEGPLTPNQLVSTILRAPVDLLWNGGIGTYVKASGETNADVGDRANDGVRVNGGELRCRIVAEGGNLGLTQLGRVEYAVNGGLVYTDAIDNSAGVDCSDHEVNIKVLLDGVVAAGELTVEQRNELLGSMTDEVGRARARQQQGADAGAHHRPPAGAADGQRARPLPRRRSRRRAGSTARSSSCRPTSRSPSARPPATACRRPSSPCSSPTRRTPTSPRSPARTCPTPSCSGSDLVGLLPVGAARALRRGRSPPTRCAGRSSPRSSSTRWSTSRGSRSTTG